MSVTSRPTYRLCHHSSCPWLPFPSDSGIETLGGMNHVQRSKTGRVPNIIGAASPLVVIEKDTSSMTLFDSILPGALESVSAGEPPAPARGRGARGGRMRRAGGARGRGAAPTNFFISCYLPEGWK